MDRYPHEILNQYICLSIITLLILDNSLNTNLILYFNATIQPGQINNYYLYQRYSFRYHFACISQLSPYSISKTQVDNLRTKSLLRQESYRINAD